MSCNFVKKLLLIPVYYIKLYIKTQSSNAYYIKTQSSRNLKQVILFNHLKSFLVSTKNNELIE